MNETHNNSNCCQILSKQVLTKLRELMNEIRQSNQSTHKKKQCDKRSNENWRSNQYETKVVSPKSRGRCFNCGAFQHESPRCPYLDQGTRCFKCSSFGHISTSCYSVTTRERRKYDSMSSVKLFSLFEQKFHSYTQRTKLLLKHYEKTVEENCNLKSTNNKLRGESAALKAVSEEDKRKVELYTKQMTGNSKNENFNERLNFSDDQERIRTFVRINSSENVECFKWNRDSTGRILNLFSDEGALTDRFEFDRIFGPNNNNENIFNSMLPMLKLAIEGCNVCIIAYGASGSGKTHTMIGNDVQPGIISRSMNFILENGSHNISDLSIKCSMYEIYNEIFYDLLNGHSKQNDIKRLTEVRIKSIDEFMQIFKIARSHRKTANTIKNQSSSRSHAIFKISMKGISRETDKIIESDILMLDCAGQENFYDLRNDTKNQIRRYEMSSINRAYSGLASVIQCLKEGDEFVNFRNSKLTFLLKPYLTGCARTLIIATTSQDRKCLATSKSIYKVINLANRIKFKYKEKKSKVFNKTEQFKSNMRKFCFSKTLGEAKHRLLFPPLPGFELKGRRCRI